MTRTTWPGAILIAVRRPQVILHRAGVVARNRRFRALRVRWLSELTNRSEADVSRYVAEIEADRGFLNQARGAYQHHTSYFPLPTDFMTGPTGSSMFFHPVSMYALVRLVRPGTVVETGGTPGKSSAFILRAMQMNDRGHLFTIDLPPPTVGQETVVTAQTHSVMPTGLESNWCVPAELRSRQQLLIGSARDLLPVILAQLGQVDVFMHDSDHSKEHMAWEFQTAWPHIRIGGWLWSDDINANDAWAEFCAGLDRTPLNFTSSGVLRK